MRLPRIWLWVVFAVFPVWAIAQQPMSPDQQAEQLLTAGQSAFNSGDTNTASAKFSELLQKFPGTRANLGAKFGLGMLQLISENPDYAKAAELFGAPSNEGSFPERGQALYQLGVAQRQLGLKELEKDKKTAETKFNDAANSFRGASEWFAGAKEEEWSARAKADRAEMEIRTGKFKEARNTVEPFTKEPALAKSKHRPLGLYYYGLACQLDKDAPTAFRVLNQDVVVNDPVFGLHAHYLVGRIHHQQDEKAEASVHYDAVLNGYEKSKLAAVEAIKAPQNFKNNPVELNRLRALANGPVPEAVAGATFQLAVLKYEAGKLSDALERFQAFAKGFEKDPLSQDAQLRIGFCQVQLNQFDEAIKTLQPLLEKAPRLADQTGFWLGKAQIGFAHNLEPRLAEEKAKRTKDGFDNIRKAIEKAGQLAQQNNPEAKARRYEMLFALGDLFQGAKQPKEAFAIYEQLWNENHQLPALRREEVLQRLVGSLGAANEFQRSDDRANEFRRTFPQSVLSASVAFRQAENKYGRAMEIEKLNDKNKAEELKTKYAEAAGQFKEVIEKFPESERLNHARLGLAVCSIQLNQLDAALKALEAIPGPDRAGELAMAAYLLGDVLLKQTPTVVGNDALEENKAREKLNAAAGLFESFASGDATAPEAPAALLKLGYCQKRLASTLADPNERNATFQKSREALEKLRKDYPKDPLAGTALLELAKVKAAQGDGGGAMNDLRAFLNSDATKGDRSAPLAALQLATLHRQHNQANEAVKVLEEARKKYEGELKDDRAEWVPLLKYHHGLAQLEAQKLPEAKKLFDEVSQQSNGKAIGAEAALRSSRIRFIELKKAWQDAINARNNSGNDQNKKNNAEQQIQQRRNEFYETAENLLRKSDELKNPLPTAEARSRMLYEAAWAFRELATDEVNAAVEEARKVALAKLPPNSPGPTIPLSAIVLTRAEQRASESYRKLFEEYADTALSVEARLEQAEREAEREKHEDVIKLLKQALDQEPSDRPVSAETMERIRLRLGGSLFAKKDFPGAASQFESIAGNEKSPVRAQALYRAGESYAASGEFAKAVEKLAVFRDKDEFKNIGGISDRAMLRLGFAQLGVKKPDDAKITFETFLNRFGNSPFAPEARFGMGSMFLDKGLPEEAIKAFEAVVAATQSEVAAKAQLQIGLIRYSQKKYGDAASALLTVSYAYDYPELRNAAILEAARAMHADNKSADAEKLLNKMLKDHPVENEWHKAAKERLGLLKK